MNFMDSVKLQRPNRSHFDLSHDRKFSMEMGRLTPCFLMDCVPSDRVTMETTQMFRMAPMISPVMHRVNARTEFFNVAKRLLWDKWPYFRQQIEGDTIVHPYIDLDEVVAGSVADYLGIPVGTYSEPLRVNALPFAAYLFVYNEYYVDENLWQEQYLYLLQDGDNSNQNVLTLGAGLTYKQFAQGKCLYRCWEKDLLTSALPFKQKGPAVKMALGTTAPVEFVNPATPSLFAPIGSPPTTAGASFQAAAPYETLVNSTTAAAHSVNNAANLLVNLAAAQAADIETWRETMVLQRFLERNAVGGTRPTEWILAHFGVKTSDARLQRPEYLGGGVYPVAISEVLQTSQTTSGTDASPQGQMAGHGISAGTNHSFSYEQEEDAFIIGFVSVLPRTAYMQGLSKMWSKFDPLEYLIPTFSHLGEQPIKTQEVKADVSASDREMVFGYQRQYYEYCQVLSSVHGDMATTLDFWHMARKFSGTPVLNEEFVSSEDVTTRIFAVTSGADTLWCHMFHNVDATRPLPKYGTPM